MQPVYKQPPLQGVRKSPQDSGYYCYFQMRDKSSLIIYSVYLACLILLTIRMMRSARLSNTSQLKGAPKKQLIVYRILLFWSGLVMANIVLGAILYLYLSHHFVQMSDLEVYSRLEFAITFTALVIFETALFFSINLWISQIRQTIQSHRNLYEPPQIQQNESQKSMAPAQGDPVTLNRIEAVVRVYILIRVAPFVVWLGLQIGVADPATITMISLYFLYYQLAQSLLTLLVLVLCAVTISKNVSFKTQREGQLVRRKYRMVMFPTLFRLSMLALNILSGFGDNNCQIIDGFQFYPAGLKSLGAVGIYVFPYFVLLKALTAPPVPAQDPTTQIDFAQ